MLDCAFEEIAEAPGREGHIERCGEQDRKKRQRECAVHEQRIRPPEILPLRRPDAVQGNVALCKRLRRKDAPRVLQELALFPLGKENGAAQPPRERRAVHPAAPPFKGAPLGQNERRFAPLAQRKQERKRARQRGTLRNKERGSVPIFVEIGARQALLHAPALRRVDAGQIDDRHLPSRQACPSLQRAHRDAVPVPHARVPARQAVIQRALARVGVADEQQFHAITSIAPASSAPRAMVAEGVRTYQTFLRAETLRTKSCAPVRTPRTLSRSRSVRSAVTRATATRAPRFV